MPRSRRERRERTHDWQQIQQYTLWPEQKLYEGLLGPQAKITTLRIFELGLHF